jgi:hypothetical protein
MYKKTIFLSYLYEELVYLIKYFDEYCFLEENKKGENFAIIIERYKHILYW